MFLLNFLLILNSFASTSMTELKIDEKWKIKYDPSEWNYIYLKQTSAVSSNIFEHRKKKFNLILQRETHIDGISNQQKLINDKCKEADLYYAKNFKGHAEVVTINRTKMCYIQYYNVSNLLSHQFIYPEISRTKNYDLFSYAWSSPDESSKNAVTDFLKGFVK